jgi:cardiolipin synthase
LLPIVGLILFFFFGVIPFKKKDYNEYENVFGNVDIKDVEESKKIIKNETKWNAYKLNFNTMHSPIYTDTKIDIIKNNNDILKQYIDLVRSAKETIYIQTYVIKKSVFFYTLANEMAKKAKQGVKVYFVYDWAGSYRKFNSKVIRMLDKAGVHVAVFNYNR